MTDTLIPRSILFGNPERTQPRLSPDGQYLSYLAPDEKNVLQVWVRGADVIEARPVTQDRKRGIRLYQWTYQPDVLLYLQDADGDENWHLFSVNVRTGDVRDLTPFPGVQARLVDLAPELPATALIAMNQRDPRLHDVYRVDLATGECTLDTENPGNFLGFTADAELQVRAATASTAAGGYELFARDTPAEPWRKLREWGPEDEGEAVAFGADPNRLFIEGTHDWNARRLLALDLSTGSEEVLAQDELYDVGDVFFHPVRRIVQAVAFYRDRLEWTILDPEVEGDFAALRAVRDGELRVVSRDLADRTWLAAFTIDDGPTYYYRYHRATRLAELLFSNQPKLEGLPLAKMQPVSFPARDGLTLHAYLTLPAGAGPGPLPTVLDVHGGPWARDTWGYRADVQWLANRGYAVLQINYRGSTGYGKQFLHAGDLEWAGKMHDDLLDGVQWLIDQGISDTARVAIFGGSYGGYATLVGLTFTPEVFAAGVDIVGPSNLFTLMASIPPYWAPMLALFKNRVGDPDTQSDLVRAKSPVFFADRIVKPLLIGQGKNDPRVKEAESEQIVEAMRQASRPVEYVLYTDEGHGFARPENRMHFFAVAEEFLARYLGGRFEPAGELEGHSAEVR